MWIRAGTRCLGRFDSGLVYATSTNPVNDGAWHHLVGTSTDGVNIKLYVDGILQQTTAIGALYSGYSASYLRIGGYNLARLDRRRMMDILMAVLPMSSFTIVRSTRLRSVRSKLPQGSVTSGLQGYWPMWMGGVTEGDRSGQANHGTATGTSVSSGPTPLTSGGGITALSSLTATGNAITINGVTTTGAQSYTGSGSVTLNGAVDDHVQWQHCGHDSRPC